MGAVRNLLSGSAVAAAALAVLVAAAPPPPTPVILGVGEPSSFTGTSAGDDQDRGIPSCPTPIAAHPHTTYDDPAYTAHTFVAAWGAGHGDLVAQLADPVFERRARSLAVTGGGPGASARVVGVGGLAHQPLAGLVADRCGVDALTRMRVVTLATPGSAALHVYLVHRTLGYRVWGVR